MFRSFFTKPSLQTLGKASLELFTPSSITVSTGPIDHSYLSTFKRFLTPEKITQHDQDHEIIVVGGGISALLGGIRPFYQEYKKTHQGVSPKITFITDEKSHWLHSVNPFFYNRPWGQPKKGLIKEYQYLLTKNFPEITADERPTFYHMHKTREHCMMQFAKEYNVEIVDDHVTSINENKSKNSVALKFKSGRDTRVYNTQNVSIYNISSQPRPTLLRDLAHCREGGLLYSEKDMEQPILIYGSGLSATWAAMDWKGPILILHKKQFPLTLNGPPRSPAFYEMFEENASIRILRNGQVIVDGEDVRSGKTITMRFPQNNCFLSTGTVFNHQLTQNLTLPHVYDINIFAGSGQVAGAIAEGSINPIGGLTHRYAVTAMLLKRYPASDFKNIAIYTNLWQAEVEKRLAAKGLALGEDFFTSITPKIKELFLVKHAPSLNEIENTLKSQYELSNDAKSLSWSSIKEILVPVTDDLEHSLHPEYYPEQNKEPQPICTAPRPSR